MYSYEERTRAVKLYIKLEKRLGCNHPPVGSHDKELTNWPVSRIRAHRDLQVSYVRSSDKYSAEQMRVAVKYCLDHDRCMAATLKALG